MKKAIRRAALTLGGFLVLGCMLACGISGKVQEAANRAKTVNDLKQLALAYHNFHAEKNRGPSGPEEWMKSPGAAEAAGLIAECQPGGRFVFFWNVRMSKLTDGTTNTVLGYESKVPTSGGAVAMADGVVHQMTAAEFAAAKKPAAAAMK